MVAEQLVATVAPGPLYPVSTVLAGLVGCADRQTHAATIGSLMSGAAVASWAVSEPGRAWAPLDPSVTATQAGSGYRIDGTKDGVEAGAQSAVLLVVVRCGDEVRQLLVPTDAPGLQIVAQQSVDLVKQYAKVHFDGVVVESCAAVGSAAETAQLIERQSQLAQVLQCAEVVGILQTVFDFIIRWALDRYTFGRPLASYQSAQTPLRRHEDVARSVSSDHGRGGCRPCRRLTRGRLVGQHRQVVRFRDGEPDRSGLCAAARWHRRHLGI